MPSSYFNKPTLQLGIFGLIWLLSCAHSISAFSQTRIRGITISAAEVERDLDKQEVSLVGDVVIVYGEQTIAAEKATIFLETEKIIAHGEVVVQNQDVYAQAESLEYFYKTGIGSFKNAFVQSGQVSLEGEVIDKIGERAYLAKNASFTACTTCPPAWAFSGSVIKAELGGYAFIDFPVFKIANFPVLFLPKLIVPLKSERQSGLLVPTWGQSRDGGFEIGQSYFWAINRSQDATFTVKNYDKRGLKGLLEYRYMLSPNSAGEMHTGFMQDRADGHQNRWFFNYEHYYLLENDYVNRVDLNFVGDRNYLIDFNNEMEGLGQPALESRISISKNWGPMHGSVETAYFTNLLEEDIRHDNSNAVHRFPAMYGALTQTAVPYTPFYFQLETSFINFMRKSSSFDEVTGTNATADVTGLFDPEADILRTGTRFDLTPRLTYPIQLMDTFDIQFSTLFKHNAYSFNTQNPNTGPTSDGAEYKKTAIRQYLQADLNVKTELFKVYDFNDGDDPFNKTLWQHKIIPSLSYGTIPYKTLDDHVFFGNFLDKRYDKLSDPLTELDFYNDESDEFGAGKVQFDYNDRLFDLEVIRLGLANKAIRKRVRGDHTEYLNIVNFELYQYYDLNHAKKADDPKPWNPLNVYLAIKYDNWETHTTAKFYPYAGVSDTSSRIKVQDPLGNFFQVNYSKLHTINDNLKAEIGKTTESTQFTAGITSKYINLVGEIEYTLPKWKTNEWSYVASFKLPGKCWTWNYHKFKSVAGNSEESRLTVVFDFGGESVTF